MTNRIGSMAVEWANSQIVYTAIGMHVTDTLSHANSKLINLSTDGNSKFSVSKTGVFRITPDLPANSNISLFEIVNSGQQLLNITPNTVHATVNVILEGQTTYSRSYAEGLQYISMGDGELTLDLGVASTFVVDYSYANTQGTITKINFIKPSTIIDEYLRSYSCSVIFRGNIAISDATWANANVWWPGGFGYSPRLESSVLTFLNNTTGNNTTMHEWPSNTWLGINSGQGFKAV